MTVVAPLKRLTVALRAGAGARGSGGPAEAPPEVVRVTFVYGIGPTGLSAFEALLSGRTAGSEVGITLEAAEIAPFFESLAEELRPLWGGRPRVALTARLEEIADAAPREIVRALAEQAAHGRRGCGGGCGCGCGGAHDAGAPSPGDTPPGNT